MKLKALKALAPCKNAIAEPYSRGNGQLGEPLAACERRSADSGYGALGNGKALYKITVIEGVIGYFVGILNENLG